MADFVPIGGQLTPATGKPLTGDTYTLADVGHMTDGLRNVATYQEMYDIYLSRRKKGMVVGIQADGSYWKLDADVGVEGDQSPSDWVEFTPSAANYYLDSVVVNSITDVDFIMNGIADIEGIDFGHNLDIHDNVIITSLLPNQILKYNGSAWINVADETGDNYYLSAVNANDITSVDFTITNGADVLGVDFGHNIEDHDDFIISSITIDDFIQWTGSEWENMTPGNITSNTTDQLIVSGGGNTVMSSVELNVVTGLIANGSTDLVTSDTIYDYISANTFWKRTGTTLKPITNGDDILLSSGERLYLYNTANYIYGGFDYIYMYSNNTVRINGGGGQVYFNFSAMYPNMNTYDLGAKGINNTIRTLHMTADNEDINQNIHFYLYDKKEPLSAYIVGTGIPAYSLYIDYKTPTAHRWYVDTYGTFIHKAILDINSFAPANNGEFNLGTSSLQWGYLYVDHTAFIDNLQLTSGSTVNIIENSLTSFNTRLATSYAISLAIANATLFMVDYTGTPANNQVAVFTDVNTIVGDINFTWDGSVLDVLSIGLAGGISVNGIETILTDDDTHIATSGAIYDAIDALILDSPIVPLGLVLTETGDYVEIEFTFDDINDEYEIWSSQISSSENFDMIAKIKSDDLVGSPLTLTIADNTYTRKSQIWYKVYAKKYGVYSIALEGTIIPVNDVAEVSNLITDEYVNSIALHWVNPIDRRLDGIEIKVDIQDVEVNLDEINATTCYTGQDENFTYRILTTDLTKYHEFWVYTKTKT